MSTFKDYLYDYENSIITEKYNLDDDMILALPEVSFEEKENILSEIKESSLSQEQQSILSQNSKIFINLCDRLKVALQDIQNCMRIYGFFENIDFEITEDYINSLYNKIKNLLDTDEVCDIIDNISDDLIFLENFCKNKNVKRLDQTLQKIESIIDNFEQLETF